MNCRKTRRDGASGTRAPRCKWDAIISTYISQVGCTNPLTREEQLELGRRIQRSRQRCRRLLLANPFLLRAALALLRRVALGTLKPGPTLLADKGEKAVTAALERVRGHIRSLERLLSHDKERFRQAMNRQTPAEDRRRALKVLAAQSSKAARLVAKCKLRPRLLNALCGRLDRLAQRISRLKTATRGSADPEAARRARRLIVRLLLAAGEPYARLLRRLECARTMSKEGDCLREELVRPFLPLVIFIAKGYRNRGLPLEDLIQEGNIGLLWAADTFEPRRDRFFSTHAVLQIKERIRRALQNDSRTIRLPGQAFWLLKKIARTKNELLFALGREPTPTELAQAVGMKEQRVERLIRSERRKHSLNGLEETETMDDETGTLLKELASQFDLLIGKLSPRLQLLITLRFGLRDNRSHTLKEVGSRLGVGKERTRQLE